MAIYAENEIHHNIFRDSSAAVKEISYENSSNELDEIREELTELKENLSKEGELYDAIEDLRRAVERGNKSDISTSIKKHIKEFSMPFFVKVASQTLMNFIDSIAKSF